MSNRSNRILPCPDEGERIREDPEVARHVARVIPLASEEEAGQIFSKQPPTSLRTVLKQVRTSLGFWDEN